MREGHTVPEITVKYPADALTDDTRAEFLYVIATTVARVLHVDLDEVDVDPMPYDSEHALRSTLVSMIIAGFDYPERMEDMTEILEEISMHVQRVIQDIFHHIAEHKKLLAVRYTPVRQDCWI